jgi:LysW-gamma-L-lysine carboxypeptidase
LFKYRFTQPVSHSAGPEQTAAEHAVNWWNAIHAYAARFNENRERVFDRLSPSLNQVETHSDGLHNTAFAQVGVRVPPDFDINAFEAAVRQFAGNAQVEAYGRVPAHQVTRHIALVRTFSTVLREHDVRPRLKVKSGTSDMNVVGPAWGCPVVAYGPGDSRLDHTPDEHLVIDEYHRAISVLTRVLEQL